MKRKAAVFPLERESSPHGRDTRESSGTAKRVKGQRALAFRGRFLSTGPNESFRNDEGRI